MERVKRIFWLTLCDMTLLTAIFILIEIIIFNLKDPNIIVFNLAMKALLFIWVLLYFVISVIETISNVSIADNWKNQIDQSYDARTKKDIFTADLIRFVLKFLMIPIYEELIRNSEIIQQLIILSLLLVLQSGISFAIKKIKFQMELLIDNKQIELNHLFSLHGQFKRLNTFFKFHNVTVGVMAFFFPYIMLEISNILSFQDEIFSTQKKLFMFIILYVFVKKLCEKSLNFIFQTRLDSEKRKIQISCLKTILKCIMYTSNLVSYTLFSTLLIILFQQSQFWALLVCVGLSFCVIVKDLLIICILLHSMCKQIRNSIRVEIIEKRQDDVPILNDRIDEPLRQNEDPSSKQTKSNILADQIDQ